MTKNHHPTILIVEDDASGRAMLGLTLRRAGYQVRSAPDGITALAILKNESFDWMITDGRMDPINGLELSRRAKELRPNLRILMVSAAYNDKDIQNYPIEALFSKPVPTENLLARLSTFHST